MGYKGGNRVILVIQGGLCEYNGIKILWIVRTVRSV